MIYWVDFEKTRRIQKFTYCIMLDCSVKSFVRKIKNNHKSKGDTAQ